MGGEKLYFLQNVSGSVSRDLSFIKGGGGGGGWHKWEEGRSILCNLKRDGEQKFKQGFVVGLIVFCERYCSLNIKIYK